jgi:hypothetical protein
MLLLCNYGDHNIVSKRYSAMACTESVKWSKSKARALLENDLLKGRIPLDNDIMSTDEVYMQRVEFAETSHEKFARRLYALRVQCRLVLARAATDAAAFDHDSRFRAQVVPQRLRWEGSEAADWLTYDVEQNHHLLMKPQDLHRSRPEYQEYPLQVFRDHIHQEIKTRKFHAMFKRNNR